MDPFLGEIQIFAGDFAPRGWELCNGKLLPISQYTQLFQVIGTTYGGDGRTNFALPNLQGAVAMGFGAGPGLTPRSMGDSGGQKEVILSEGEMPVHSHLPAVGLAPATAEDPKDNFWGPAAGGRRSYDLYTSADNLVKMSADAIKATGGNQPHNNMQPYVGLNYIIAIEGIYPPRP